MRLTRRPPKMLLIAVGILMSGVLAACGSTNPESDSIRNLEQSTVKIALTGSGSLSNVPMYLAQELGYFNNEGLTVKFADLSGGSDAIKSLITDTVDATTNVYDHTISVQQKGKAIESVTVFRQTPSFSLMVSKKHADAQSVQDIADLKIGVVSLGGSTEEIVKYLFEANGLDPERANLVSIGATSTAISAVESGQVGALIAVDPTLTKLLQSGQAEHLMDLRSPDATEEVYGGTSPFWSLLVRNEFADEKPRTTQALVTACVKALEYMHSHSAEEIATNVPEDVFYPEGDKTLFVNTLKGNIESFTTDGLMPADGSNRILEYLKVANPDTDYSGVNLDETYDGAFARRVASDASAARP